MNIRTGGDLILLLSMMPNILKGNLKYMDNMCFFMAPPAYFTILSIVFIANTPYDKINKRIFIASVVIII